MKRLRRLVLLVLLAVATTASNGAPPAAPDVSVDGRSVRELLETVRRRGEDLDRREADIAARADALGAARRAAAAEVARLESVAKTLGLTGEPGSGPTIARVFETMRPDDAAAILDRLDEPTVRVVLGRMHERPLEIGRASCRERV